ncbi:FAD-dependent oxidoreductase [Nocardioides zeae]|uniref:FAD-dependent oxidoreductase n=1 Tax=Nocardioides imazamoxiresistens TaxID=3231893 RepID=A0ABU3PUT8_9ACTN|nr:FAD-dependent oxidoreductase [Nocardioides zeae]MDT9592998.1 FAD-dependent oxidoreductase [Nocardioides zeae]
MEDIAEDAVLVAGAGISGIACARALVDAGVPVVVVDRGYRVGGRMASKRVDDRPVDLGAAYFTVPDDDPAFAAVVESWRAAGLAREWTRRFHATSADGLEPKDGPVRWSAPGALRSLVEQLAEGLDVRRGAVAAVSAGPSGVRVGGATVRAVVLAMPDAQAVRLLDDSLADVAARLDREWEPVLALVASWDRSTWEVDGVFVNDSEVLSFVADDGRRRGDGAPVLVAHSTPDFARRHLEDPDAAGPEMVAALRAVLDLPEPASSLVKRWGLARPTGERDEAYLLDDRSIGVCGDGWGPTPRVATAWRSGHELGAALARTL